MTAEKTKTPEMARLWNGEKYLDKATDTLIPLN
jgi:hypothetical protein